MPILPFVGKSLIPNFLQPKAQCFRQKKGCCLLNQVVILLHPAGFTGPTSNASLQASASPFRSSFSLHPNRLQISHFPKHEKKQLSKMGYFPIFRANALFWCVGKLDLPTQTHRNENKIAGGTE
jgi:hypothetical protein